jgi:uncharacterized ferredoxin-like protein
MILTQSALWLKKISDNISVTKGGSMPINYEEIKHAALKDIAEMMCVAARTAPKGRGVDNLVILILTADEKARVIDKMKEIAERDSRPVFLRDAGNLVKSDQVVVIATRTAPRGLNCGYCGYPACEGLSKTGGICAFNTMDLGIALGSAVSIAGQFHADNRIMYTVGKAANELGLLEKDMAQAIAIPLSATGKNIYFDRA